MPAPTLISVTPSTFSDSGTTDEATASVSWQSGDRILVKGMWSNNQSSSNDGISTPTATGLTFSLIGSVNTTLVTGGDDTINYMWSALAGSNGSSVVSAVTTTTDTAKRGGIVVEVWRGSDGFGTPATLDGSSAKTISLTRGSANSCVSLCMADWNQVGDVTVTATPTGTVDLASAQSGQADFFSVTYGDQGATGTTSYGIANHTGTVDMSGIAVEILGTAGGGGSTTAINLMRTQQMGFTPGVMNG